MNAEATSVNRKSSCDAINELMDTGHFDKIETNAALSPLKEHSEIRKSEHQDIETQ